MIPVEESDRLKKLPPYLFVELDRLKEDALASGVDVIDLGIGDPDKPTPDHVAEALAKAAKTPKYQGYPSTSGMADFRAAASRWLKKRFEVDLNPDTEIRAVIGSKEGLAHMAWAFINPGDTALVPEPAYPVYNNGVILAGGSVHFMPLLEKNGFLPDLEAIPESVADTAKLMFVNFPNNPTGATCDLGYYEKLTDFAKKHRIVVASDSAYADLGLDGYRPPSLLQVPGAMDVAVEFHSLSKTYNMAGCRIGFVAGRAEIVAALTKVKNNVDSGPFMAIQAAAAEAMDGDQSVVEAMRLVYTRRRDVMVKGLQDAGFSVQAPRASFFLWLKVPDGYTSETFTKTLLAKAGVMVTPGHGFGPSGEGYVRISLTRPAARLVEAAERMKKVTL